MRTDERPTAEPGRAPGASGRVDPRVERTRALLQDALLRLARSRPLDDISIADIADAATVNRTTFYQHYVDKETLLADAIDAEAARQGADLTGMEGPLRYEQTPPPQLRRYLEHVAGNADLYRRALGVHGSPIAMMRLRDRITALVLAGFELYGPGRDLPQVPLEIAAASISGSIYGLLLAWLEREPLAPPEAAAEWMWRALTRFGPDGDPR
jgi:AcrR family transcriptional regulator